MVMMMEVVITGQDKISDDGGVIMLMGWDKEDSEGDDRTATIEGGGAEVMALGRTRVVRPEARRGEAR